MNNRSGFTLFELIIVLAVSSILIVPIGMLLMSSAKNNTNEQERVASLSNVRASAQIVEVEIRESNQSIKVEQLDGCILIHDKNANKEQYLLSKYCVINETLYRNDVVLVDKIAVFDIKADTDESYLVLTIEDIYGGRYEQTLVYRN